ncbi:hypothetical protein [Microtetraspora malaysiensis]|uniref:hypothetical protein n=1 Tax=Microtetraspora malaysiensis TaxID=161358 RepID=UPI000830C835|nr:hypothetical protein [Microtetraspora malaysiensis]
MLSKRVRLALSAGVLGVALTATLTAAANADEAPRPGSVECVKGNVTVAEKDGKVVMTVDGKEVKVVRKDVTGTAAAVMTPAESVPAEAVPAEAVPAEAVPAESMPAELVPAESVPATSGASESGTSAGDASAGTSVAGAAVESTPAFTCVSGTVTE